MGFFKFGRVIEKVNSIVTAGGTTTLTNTSQQNIRFTGSSNQDLVLPDATTCSNGTLFRVKNESTGLISIQYDDASPIDTIFSGKDKLLVLFDNSTSNGVWGVLLGSGEGGILLSDVAILKDVKAANTPAGTFTNGAWRTRTLNTTENGQGWVSLSSDQFTLDPGYYFIKAIAPAAATDRHKLKIRNITDSTDDIIGDSAQSPTGGSQTLAYLSGVISISASKTFELQHQAQTTRASDGFGIESNFGVSEVYAIVEITRLHVGDPTSQTFIGSRATHSALAIANNTEVTLIPTTVTYNEGSGYNNGTGVFTAPSIGYYKVTAMLYNGGSLTPSAGQIEMYVRKNGAGHYSSIINSIGASTAEGCIISDTLQLNATETVEIRAYQSNGASENFDVVFTVEKVG